MKKDRNNPNEHVAETVLSVIILIALTVIVIVGVYKVVNTKVHADDIDSEAYRFVEEQGEVDAANVVSVMKSISASREDATLKSIAESVRQSVEESLSEYLRESESVSVAESEQQSVQESIAESIRESVEISIAESVHQSIAAMEAAAEAALANGDIRPGEVVKTTTASIPLIRKLFADTMVIGDSRAKGIVDTGVLTTNEVCYYGGASVGTLYETTENAAGYMRGKTLFIVGLNDLGWYHGDAARFKADYINLISTYLSVNPGSRIYLQQILPVFEGGRSVWTMMDYIPQYDRAIREICDEYGYTFVSANDYCLSKYVVSRDCAHFGLEFYLLWAQTIANQMGLWEDLGT